MVRGRHVKEVTLGKLHEAYVRVCRHRQLRHEGECEFVGVCNMLEARGVISLKNSKAKETRLLKVSTCTIIRVASTIPRDQTIC
jgi:cell division control protein 6